MNLALSSDHSATLLPLLLTMDADTLEALRRAAISTALATSNNFDLSHSLSVKLSQPYAA